MKVCLDTNVIIDILGKTSDFFDSYVAFDVSLLRSFEVFISVTSTTDIAYLLPRRNYASEEQAKAHLVHLLTIAEILDARSVDVALALKSNMPDYEDALLAYMAQRNDIDLIITRNLKDFKLSPVPAMSPKQFADLYKPPDVEYAMVDFLPNKT
jgi:predicted nucleic acid-binding protein